MTASFRRGPGSENETRVDEVGFMRVDDIFEQPLGAVALFGSDHRADREGSQGIVDRQGAFGRILPARKGEDIGTALTLAIDVDAADLVDQRIDQPADDFRVLADDRYLLTMFGRDDVVQRGVSVLERNHRNDRAKLLASVEP